MTNGYTESDLMAQILLACSRGDARLFRSNSGLAWQGTILEHTTKRLVLLDPRAIRVGCTGMSDLIGWSAGGRYTAIEVKSEHGRVRPEQATFLNRVLLSGGRAGVARDVDQAREILKL